jgi:hypothetical protein
MVVHQVGIQDKQQEEQGNANAYRPGKYTM